MLFDIKMENPDRNGYSLLNADHRLKPPSKRIGWVCFWIQVYQPWDVLAFIQMAHCRPVTSHSREQFSVACLAVLFWRPFYVHALTLGNTWLRVRSLISPGPCPFNLSLDFSAFSTERL